MEGYYKIMNVSMNKIYYNYEDATEFNPDLCSLIAIEECSELIQAISKAKRGKLNKDNLAEEIADVLICLDWIEKIYDIDQKEVMKWMERKNLRIVDRLNSGEFQ